LTGQIKETAGRISGDEQMEMEGNAGKTVAEAKETVGDVLEET